MKLEELSSPEKTALFSLIRLMIRADHEFSKGEASGLMELAEELGADEFKALMEESAGWELDEAKVKQRAMAVDRTELQEEIYGALYTIATSDGTDGRENALLDWLAETWQLEISQEDPT